MAWVSADIDVQSDVQMDGRNGPVGPMSPNVRRKDGMEIEAPLTMVSYPNIKPPVNATLPVMLSTPRRD
jgi:hypothetical protein